MNKPILTIGMAVYDDFDGVYFSIQALRMFHEECADKERVKFLVVDNNPDSPSGKATKDFIEKWAFGKYIPYSEKRGTAVRDIIFENSISDYTLCIDSHVLIEPGGIRALLDYYQKNPDTKNLIQGPLWYDDLKNISTHFGEEWRSSMYGTWQTNKAEYDKSKPFEIPMQGLGLFSCKTSNWLKFNDRFIGFGGEEGYIHEKFRQAGGKCICLPQLKWCHRFSRPSGVKYPLALEDRVWNYFVGWMEIYNDPNHQMIKDIYEHFNSKLPAGRIDMIFEKVLSGEKDWK
ncbi:MAG: glycosyltransferase [Patescibacteria group bacterium]|jgi:hypothetical protein